MYSFFLLLVAYYISELGLNTNTTKSDTFYNMQEFNNIKNLIICDSLKKGMEQLKSLLTEMKCNNF